MKSRRSRFGSPPFPYNFTQMSELVNVIGGGLAGVEAAWQAAELGAEVNLYEMRPVMRTPAHRTDQLAEIVCSNSLKTDEPGTAPYLLKEELRRGGSLVMEAAAATRVPAGAALSVDRIRFAEYITRRVEQHPHIRICREEITALGGAGATVVATGPLTSDALTAEIMRFTGDDQLYFYDAIAPILSADSIDMSFAFRASRYGKSLDGSDDYINCPFNKHQYESFVDALLAAEFYEPHIPADNTPYFEGCLPVEEIARRGRDTLRFGPMKPIGLTDPRTGRWPYAAVQLRQENQRADSYNLVGFQNHMRFGEQQRVLRMIPGLQNAEFLRYGQVHRNTYINGPALLAPTLQMRTRPEILFAGQISGVEGYVESIATGLIAGRAAAALAAGEPPRALPRETAMGSLTAYVSGADPLHYQPANITFDLLPKLENPPRDKKVRYAEVCRRALAALEEYLCVHV